VTGSPQPQKFTVLPSHRVPAHLARRFHQVCLGVTGEILLEEDLTPQVYGIMASIVEQPDSTQRQIAHQFGVDEASVGQIVDILEARKLVTRRVDPKDRRSRLLRATRRGGELRKRLRPLMHAAQERVLEPLTRAERALLIDMLVRVLEANDAYAKPGNGRRKPRKVPNVVT
jgi:MarR family transcriptional regulator, temperature-dependent positive regulator of motility